MDPITQGTLGATLSASCAKKPETRNAAWLGVLGGIAADIDIIFQSPSDPLLFLEFHRQFTHSLVFIPIGGLICALLGYRLFRKSLSFRQVYLFCTLGFATHGLLDACTTYGTQLFWPFSTVRIAWNTISIIDPLFTVPILVLVILGARYKRPLLPRIALVWVFLYLGIGVVQRDRAVEAGLDLARSRGHDPVRLEAKPGFANLVLWKVVYETEGQYFVDAVRVGMGAHVFPGEQIEKLDLATHFPWLDPTSQQAIDVERFRWFSNRYLAVTADQPNRIIDIRYSVLPNQIKALWAIELDPGAEVTAHAQFVTTREASNRQLSKLLEMIFPD